jgi:hypothetical protein
MSPYLDVLWQSQTTLFSMSLVQKAESSIRLTDVWHILSFSLTGKCGRCNASKCDTHSTRCEESHPSQNPERERGRRNMQWPSCQPNCTSNRNLSSCFHKILTWNISADRQILFHRSPLRSSHWPSKGCRCSNKDITAVDLLLLGLSWTRETIPCHQNGVRGLDFIILRW